MCVRGSLRLVLFTSLVILPAQTQNVNMGHPAEEIHAQKIPSPEELRARLSDAQFQKNSEELASLCRSVASDMDGVKQGLLQKDAVDRLKRVEKLAKRVRDELQR